MDSEIFLFTQDGWPQSLSGITFSLMIPGKHLAPVSYSTWHWGGGVNSRGTRVKPDHRCPLPLGWLNLPNPFTSCELEEKPSSLRLELSLAVGLSAEATGPISLCAPLWVSFCFLASFLWDMCKGKYHSQMVTVASKSWKIRLLFSHPSSTPKPGALSRNRVKAGPPRSRGDKPKSFWNF